MDLKTYENSLSAENPPEGLTPPLQAMWYDAKGDWHMAHTTVQDESDSVSAWVHAYLHRKEGDDGNASYWYSRAGRPFFRASLQEEWRGIVSELLESD